MSAGAEIVAVDFSCPATGPRCPICGDNSYVPGPNGRLNGGKPPQCATCGSLERHRAIRAVYAVLPKFLVTRRCLQFAHDASIDPDWFAAYEVSQYGHKNSLDLMHIARPDFSYDWVVLNHVLEHVKDDIKALDELGRISKLSGVVQINVPSPAYRLQTEDWGYPDPKRHEHYRIYGSDFPDRVRRSTFRCAAIQTIASDPMTGSFEIAYFLSRDIGLLKDIALHLTRSGFATIRAV